MLVEDPGHVGEQDQLFRAQGLGHPAGHQVGVYVQRLTLGGPPPPGR